MDRTQRVSTAYLMTISIIGIIVGLIMIFYPGGTMALMKVAFTLFQVVLSVFILAYMITEGVYNFKAQRKGMGWTFIAIGIIATVLIWLFKMEVIIYVIAIFLILAGISEIVAGIRLEFGRYILILFGLINIMVGVIILRHPVALPILIGWYILYWGLSRLFFALELRKRIS